MQLGFSSGSIYQLVPSISPEAVQMMRETGCNAIELCAAKLEEVALFPTIKHLQKEISEFEYISIHSPTITISYEDNHATHELLKQLEEYFHHFNCRCVVIHPARVKDWSIFERYAFTVALENMSSDVPFYKPDQLAPIFQAYPQLRMVLDVKHAHESDPKHTLIRELWDAFKDRIIQIHLSGYDGNLQRHNHLPLHETGQRDILQSVMDKPVPIIIESDCDTIEKVKREYEYIASTIKELG